MEIATADLLTVLLIILVSALAANALPNGAVIMLLRQIESTLGEM